MGWSIGFDSKWGRDIGYGVPCTCDHPDCNKEINRGISYVCGGEPSGGEKGCGLFFCSSHLGYKTIEENGISTLDLKHQLCERCLADEDHYEPKPDIKEWKNHKKTDDSWSQWRKENPELAKLL